jgi:hypothetical protein
MSCGRRGRQEQCDNNVLHETDILLLPVDVLGFSAFKFRTKSRIAAEVSQNRCLKDFMTTKRTKVLLFQYTGAFLPDK